MDDKDIVLKRKIKWNRIFFGCFSVIFMVAAGVGIASAVMGANRSSEADFNGKPNSSSSMSSISAICGEADYKDKCISSLSSSVEPDSSSRGHAKELIRKVIESTISEVHKALDLSVKIAPQKFSDSMQLTQNFSGSMKYEALADCQELLQYAIDELQRCLSDISSKNLKDLPNRIDELKNWLGASMSFQSSCIDGLSDTQLKLIMQNGLVNATQLTSNALAIVTGLTSILTDLQIDVKLSSTLVEDAKNKLHHGNSKGTTEYPHWFELKDRKLMLQDSGKVTPNAVVAKDGSGQFKTISAALEALPANYHDRFVIYVKAGIYDEQVIVTKKMKNVLMYGEGPRKTIITGSKNYVDGTTTYRTATFAVIGDGFMAKSMGFQNTAGAAKNQAVALRVQSDRSVFFNCQIEGFQNTLYVQAHRQFYRDCVISGTIDFIFGDSAVILQNCSIFVRRPMDHQENTITAQGRSDKRSPTGIVIHNCQIMPDAELFPVRSKIRSYLGRPLKKYARTVIMESTIGDVIQPQGWVPLDGDFALDTLLFAEYGNRGPGSSTSGRVKWKGYKLIINRTETLEYTTNYFIQGELWLWRTHIPYVLGFFN